MNHSVTLSVFAVANATKENKQDLLAELELMKTLEPHPNVIRLLGCCSDTGIEALSVGGG